MIKEITEAIHRINPDAKISIHRLEHQTVDDCLIFWREGTPEISREDIKAEMEND